MEFVNFLNCQHPNMKFTFEEEIDGCIPFIGRNLHRCLGNSLQKNNVYRTLRKL